MGPRGWVTEAWVLSESSAQDGLGLGPEDKTSQKECWHGLARGSHVRHPRNKSVRLLQKAS